MSLNSVAKVVKVPLKYIQKHGTKILTGAACCGVVTTVVEAVRVTPEAQFILDQLELDHAAKDIPEATRWEKAKAVWKLYIPAGISGALTIGCIIGVDVLHTKQNATIAALYSASEMARKEYCEKVRQVVGEKKEEDIRKEIAVDKRKRTPYIPENVVNTGHGDNLYFETLTGQYFRSSAVALKEVQASVSEGIATSIDMIITVNDLCGWLGINEMRGKLRDNGLGDILGWGTKNPFKMIISYGGHPETEEPCGVITYANLPISIEELNDI